MLTRRRIVLLTLSVVCLTISSISARGGHGGHSGGHSGGHGGGHGGGHSSGSSGHSSGSSGHSSVGSSHSSLGSSHTAGSLGTAHSHDGTSHHNGFATGQGGDTGGHDYSAHDSTSHTRYVNRHHHDNDRKYGYGSGVDEKDRTLVKPTSMDDGKFDALPGADVYRWRKPDVASVVKNDKPKVETNPLFVDPYEKFGPPPTNGDLGAKMRYNEKVLNFISGKKETEPSQYYGGIWGEERPGLDRKHSMDLFGLNKS